MSYVGIISAGLQFYIEVLTALYKTISGIRKHVMTVDKIFYSAGRRRRRAGKKILHFIVREKKE